LRARNNRADRRFTRQPEVAMIPLSAQVPREPPPGGTVPGDMPPPPTDRPRPGPSGPRTPYPVDDPGISDPTGPGSEPDYLPGDPSNPKPRL
jgi:hypothetical protein